MQRMDNVADKHLGLGIKCTSCLVENEQAGNREQGPGQAKALPLTTTQPHPTLTNHGVDAVALFAQESVEVGLCQSSPDLVVIDD